MKPNKIFNTIVFCLFVIFLSIYGASKAGYFEYTNKKEAKFTEEKMKKFEKDLEAGKNVNLKDYLSSDIKNYDNKITNMGSVLSDIVSNGIISTLEGTFKLIEKLIE